MASVAQPQWRSREMATWSCSPHRNVEALAEAVREISDAGGRAEVLVMDVTDGANVGAAIHAMLERGACDVRVNNAGSCHQAEFLMQDASVRDAEMALNYFGALRVTRALLPALIARGEGLIVKVSSLLGSIAAPGTANYSATKAALEAWSHGMRHEVARFGVRVSVFVSPHTATEMDKAVRFEGVPSLPIDYTARPDTRD